MDRVLIIDHKVATPERDSGSLRMVHLIRVLSELGQEVTYLPQTLADDDERLRLAALCDSLGLEPIADRSIRRHLRNHGLNYRVALVCRVSTAGKYLPIVRRRCPEAWTVFDTVDLHYLREMRQAEMEGAPRHQEAARKLRQREFELMMAADETLVVSTFEAELLAQDNPAAKVRVISNIHEIQTSGPSFEDRQGLLFVAGFEHRPNIDAAKWLVQEIMPRIWDRLPAIELTIVGSSPPTAVRELQSQRVTVTGFVPRMEPFLESARLSLAPLRYGAGVKGKITQSLAAGLPVVATRLAGEGMPIEDRRDILMADGPADLAEAVVRAYLDQELWQRLVDSGRDVAAKYFSFDAARRSVGALLNDIPGQVDGDN